MAQNGALFGKKSDISELAENVKKLDKDKSSSDKDSKDKDKKKGSIPKKPQYEDLNKMVGNLGLAVPTGFWMVHNDLLEVIKVLKDGGSGGSMGLGEAGMYVAIAAMVSKYIPDILAAAPDILKAGGDAIASGAKGIGEGVATGAKGIGDAAVNVIMATKKTGDASVDKFMEDEAFGDEMLGDSDVKSFRKMAFISYLRGYYANLIEPFGYKPKKIDANEWKLKKDTSLASIGDNLTSIASSFAGNTVQSVMNAIQQTHSNGELDSDPDVKALKKMTYIAYLRGYYANLIEPFGYKPKDINKNEWTLKKDTNLASIGDNLGQALGGLVSGPVDAIMGSLTNSIANIVESFDPDVDAIRKTGYMVYLKTYYANLIEPYGFEVKDINKKPADWVLKKSGGLSRLGNKLGQFLGGLVGQPVSMIMDSLTSSVANIVESFDPDVDAVRKAGYKFYLRAYYNNLVEPYGFQIKNVEKDVSKWELKKEGGLASLGRKIGDAIGGMIGGSVSAIGQSIVNTALDAGEGVLDKEAREIRSGGYQMYLKAYFANMIEPFGYKVKDVNKSPTEWVLQENTSFASVMKDIGGALGELYAGPITKIAEGLSNRLLDITQGKDYVALYAQAYWTSLIESMGFEVIENGDKLTLKSTVEGRESKKGLFKSISEVFSGNETSRVNSAFTESLEKNMNKFLDKGIKDTVQEYAGPYVGTFLSSYFENLSQDIKNNPKDWRLSRDSDRKDFAASVLKAVSKSFTAEGINAAVEVNSVDYSETLNNINASLIMMKTAIDTISNSIGLDVQTDLKTIAENSGRSPVVMNTVDESFDYANSEPR